MSLRPNWLLCAVTILLLGINYRIIDVPPTPGAIYLDVTWLVVLLDWMLVVRFFAGTFFGYSVRSTIARWWLGPDMYAETTLSITVGGHVFTTGARTWQRGLTTERLQQALINEEIREGQ